MRISTGHVEAALDLRHVERLQRAEAGRGEVAGDAAHAHAILAVGRDRDVEHRDRRARHSRRSSRRPAHRRASSMIPSWSSPSCELARRAHHAVGSRRRGSPPSSASCRCPGHRRPGAPNTPSIPARALGAPHTTCTGCRRRHRRSAPAACRPADGARRSAPCATVNGASASAGLSTPSTSSPIAVSVSAIVAASASVSRCSLSQRQREFHAPTPPLSVGTSRKRKP